jgi:hypothetical protein
MGPPSEPAVCAVMRLRVAGAWRCAIAAPRSKQWHKAFAPCFFPAYEPTEPTHTAHPQDAPRRGVRSPAYNSVEDVHSGRADPAACAACGKIARLGRDEVV